MQHTIPGGADDPERLNRSVGLLGASLSGIGVVLGAGIYVLIGAAAGEVGNSVWLAFLLGAILASATGLAYAELSSMIPEAGAAAAFAEEAFGRRIGFIAGWMNVLVNVVAAPAVAIGFGGYFVGLIGGDQDIVAGLAVLACAAIVLVGVGQTIVLASIFATIEALGLLLVIFVGAPFLGDVDLLALEYGPVSLLAGAALVFFAYQGFEEIATLSEEVKEPTKNVPRALLIAIGVTTILYILVATVAVSVVPAADLADDPSPLAFVVEIAASERMADGLSVVALFATFNTVLLVLATAPRVMYGMARRRILPSYVGLVWRRRGTPWVAVLISTAIAIAFGLTGDIGYVAQVTNFAIFTLFAIVNAAAIRLRWTQPDRVRPFRLRGTIGRLPLVPLGGLSGAVLLSAFMDQGAVVTGLMALVTGIAASFIFVRPITPRETA